MEMNTEQVRDATTTEEMRAEIFRLQRLDPLVRSVMDAANYRGMSAEDRYTMLAYHALRQKNHMQALILEGAMMNPMPPMILIRPPGAKPDG